LYDTYDVYVYESLTISSTNTRVKCSMQDQISMDENVIICSDHMWYGNNFNVNTLRCCILDRPSAEGYYNLRIQTNRIGRSENFLRQHYIGLDKYYVLDGFPVHSAVGTISMITCDEIRGSRIKVRFR
jgi:hypothetical protein